MRCRAEELTCALGSYVTAKDAAHCLYTSRAFMASKWKGEATAASGIKTVAAARQEGYY